jgi:hypothetical protein
MHVTRWDEEQRADDALEDGMEWIRGEWRGDLKRALGDAASELEGRELLKEKDALVLVDRVLYRNTTLPEDIEAVRQFVVPKRHRVSAINGCHRDAGHQGKTRTLSLARERFWWPGMRKEVLSAVESCGRCQAYEAKSIIAPMESIRATQPLELVHVDYTSIESDIDPAKQTTAKNVLVITDHFTRYSLAFVTKDQKASTTAKCLYEEFISKFGVPARLLSDQGRNFTSGLIKELAAMFGIKKLQTTSYHAQTNGQVERYHQTLMRMLGKLSKEKKENWPQHLSELCQAYNSTRSAITGYSPHYLMFGRRPRLPVDFLFPTRQAHYPPKRTSEYVVKLQESLQKAFQAAREQTTAEAENQKRYYDRKSSNVVLEPGDVVLVRADAAVGKRKIMDRWSEKTYTVVRRLATDSPVYLIEDERKRAQSVHRNRLLLLASQGTIPLQARQASQVITPTNDQTNTAVGSPGQSDAPKPTEAPPEGEGDGHDLGVKDRPIIDQT